MEVLTKVLQWINDAVIEDYLNNRTEEAPATQRPFEASKPLRERDEMILTLLNSAGHQDVSFCVCDPDTKDCPIVFASDGFCNFTGYDSKEIEGQNCRFLQGPETNAKDVDQIRTAIKEQKEASVNLLNYRKDGTPFNNQFFILPMYSDGEKNKRLQYFVGIQCSVERLGPAQCPKNVGWIYTSGLHS